MKKKIFETYVKQSFNALDLEESGKWYIPDKVIEKRDYVYGLEHYILAETVEEAIEKYKKRYNWNDFDYVISPYGSWLNNYPCVNEKNPEFNYTVHAIEKCPSIDVLKEDMSADEFFEYCRQEMFPLEVVLSEGED